MLTSEQHAELNARWQGIVAITEQRVETNSYSHPQMVADLARDFAGLLLHSSPGELIETLDGLDLLPLGCLVLEEDSETEGFAFPWVKVHVADRSPMWSCPGEAEDCEATDINLPVRVLWAPKP